MATVASTPTSPSFSIITADTKTTDGSAAPQLLHRATRKEPANLSRPPIILRLKFSLLRCSKRNHKPSLRERERNQQGPRSPPTTPSHRVTKRHLIRLYLRPPPDHQVGPYAFKAGLAWTEAEHKVRAWRQHVSS